MHPEEPSTHGRSVRALLDRLAEVDDRIRAAVARAGRPSDSVRMLLATKTVEPERILIALAAGFTLIGENRVQEVVAKAPVLESRRAEGGPGGYESHFIGHLQNNKINQLLPHIRCLQTVDSAELGQRLNSRLEVVGGTLEVLVQANVSGEESKAGVRIDELPGLLASLDRLPRLRVAGYMTIGLNSADLSAVRAGYRDLTDFRDEALASGLPGAEFATELSMGMSGDFAEAIAEGSTMVRIGSAVFGQRDAPPPP